MVSELLRIGEVAARAGVSTRTVDFYTNLGLLTPSGRTSGNFRLYDPGTVQRIHAIRRLETHGVALDDIVRALRTPDDTGLLTRILDQLNQDVHTLRATLPSADPEVHGLLAVIATRIHSLVATALEIATDLLPPV